MMGQPRLAIVFG